MKPEFSEILIPNAKLRTDSASTISYVSVNSSLNKWLVFTTFLLTLIVTVVTTGFIVRYEGKLEQYEERIFSLENELEFFYEQLKEHAPMTVPDEDFEYETHSHRASSLYDDSSEDAAAEFPKEILDTDKTAEPFGEVKLQVEETITRRNKRQIPFPQVPTFGPEVERTGDGVPVVESSYLERAGVSLVPRYITPTTTDSEGLRLYEGLVETGGRNEPKSLDFANRQGLNPILPHHQVSAAWSEKAESRRPRIELKSGDSENSYVSGFNTRTSSGPQFANDLTYTRSNSARQSQTSYSSQSNAAGSGSRNYGPTGGNSGNTLTSGGSSPGTTFHRNSRVPATGDFLYPQTRSTTQTRAIQYPPLKKLSYGDGEGEVIARVLQSDNEADNEGPHIASASANHGQTATAEASSTRTRTGYRRNRTQNQNQGVQQESGTRSATGSRLGQRYNRKHDNSEDDSGEISIVKAEAWVEGPKPMAAHFVADVSNYTTAHRHYDGNGRLRNADGIFAAWRPSEWMTADGGDGTKNFVLNANGVLTVKQSGLYYIYAQIHYLDEHDINGFTVQVNTEPFLQCTTMTETYQSGSKSNSCFTAGVTFLKENDRILIKDIETNRYSIFKPEKSFFGLMRIGETGRSN